MRATPLWPASTARQKASRPVPLGLSTPMPVMTARAMPYSDVRACASVTRYCTIPGGQKGEYRADIPMALYSKQRATWVALCSDRHSRGGNRGAGVGGEDR